MTVGPAAAAEPPAGDAVSAQDLVAHRRDLPAADPIALRKDLDTALDSDVAMHDAAGGT